MVLLLLHYGLTIFEFLKISWEIRLAHHLEMQLPAFSFYKGSFYPGNLVIV